MDRRTIQSPIGKLLIEAEGDTLHHIRFETVSLESHKDDTQVLLDVEKQLTEYFDGKRIAFSVPYAGVGTPFQEEVWEALTLIPYGETWSYKKLAESIGKPTAVRAVASALNRNPIPIIVPCHRVIGSNGALVGYNGGLERKKLLLALEQNKILRG